MARGVRSARRAALLLALLGLAAMAVTSVGAVDARTRVASAEEPEADAEGEGAAEGDEAAEPAAAEAEHEAHEGEAGVAEHEPEAAAEEEAAVSGWKVGSELNKKRLAAHLVLERDEARRAADAVRFKSKRHGSGAKARGGEDEEVNRDHTITWVDTLPPEEILPGVDFYARGFDVVTGEQPAHHIFQWTYGGTVDPYNRERTSSPKVMEAPGGDKVYFYPDQMEARSYEECEFSSETNSFASSYDISKDWSLSVSIDIDVPGIFSYSMSMEVQEARSRMTGGNVEMVRSQAHCLVSAVQMTSRNFDPEFLAAARGLVEVYQRMKTATPLPGLEELLPTQTSEELLSPEGKARQLVGRAMTSTQARSFQMAATTFFDTFGTHYADRGALGGKVVSNTFVRKSEYAQSHDRSFSLETSFSVTIPIQSVDLTIGGSYNRKEESSGRTEGEQEQEATSIKAVGGEPGSFAGDLTSAWQNWAATVPQNPVPLQYKLKPIAELLQFKDPALQKKINLESEEEAKVFGEVVRLLSLSFIRAKRYRGPHEFVFFFQFTDSELLVADQDNVDESSEKAYDQGRGRDTVPGPGEYHQKVALDKLRTMFNKMGWPLPPFLALLEEGSEVHLAQHRAALEQHMRQQVALARSRAEQGARVVQRHGTKASAGLVQRVRAHARRHRALARDESADATVMPLSPSELDARLVTLPRALHPRCNRARRVLALALAEKQTAEESGRLIKRTLELNDECLNEKRAAALEARKRESSSLGDSKLLLGMEVLGANGWESGEFDAVLPSAMNVFERLTMRWVDFGMVGKLRIRLPEGKDLAWLALKTMMLIDMTVGDVYAFDYFNPRDKNPMAAEMDGDYAIAKPMPLVLYPPLLDYVKTASSLTRYDIFLRSGESRYIYERGDVTLLITGERGSFRVPVPTLMEGTWGTMGQHGDMQGVTSGGLGTYDLRSKRVFMDQKEFHDHNNKATRWSNFAYEGPSVGRIASVDLVVAELPASEVSEHVAEAPCRRQIEIARDICTALLTKVDDKQSGTCSDLYGKRMPNFYTIEVNHEVVGLDETHCEMVVAAMQANTRWGEEAQGMDLGGGGKGKSEAARKLDRLLTDAPDPFRCEFKEDRWNRWTPSHEAGEMDPEAEAKAAKEREEKGEGGEKNDNEISEEMSPGCIIGKYGCKNFLWFEWGCSHVNTCEQIFPDNALVREKLCPVFMGTTPDWMKRSAYIEELMIVDGSSNPGSLTHITVKDTIFGGNSRSYRAL